jgi:hypothetical protein
MSVLSKTAAKALVASSITTNGAETNTAAGVRTPLDSIIDSYQDAIPQLTTAQINALTPTLNQLAFNTDRNYMMQYNGTIWVYLVAMFIGDTAAIAGSTPKEGQLFYNTTTDSLLWGDGITHVAAQKVDECWLTNGNTATDDTVNFLGTTDAQDLVIKTNDVEAFRVNTDGEIEFEVSTEPTDNKWRLRIPTDSGTYPSGLFSTADNYFCLGFYKDTDEFSFVESTSNAINIRVKDSFGDNTVEISPTATTLNNPLVYPLTSYADDAAADADTDLPSGSFYKITGSRAVYQKP